ncbi:MAG: CYTH domain-containing protein [Clostridium sp.]
MQELETRIIDIDVDWIRQKLISINGILVKKENQINHIFDYKDGSLLRKKGYARIREVQDILNMKTVNYMTVKKLISQDIYKVMEENETIIESAKEGKNIFNSLGLQLVESISKYRESYKYKNTLVEIDINDEKFCPFPYIEIETNVHEELEEVLQLLGYSLKDTTSKTIYEILEAKGVMKGL